jgi:hypothetical protein
MLAGLMATLSSGVGGNEANLLHFLRPLPVVVAAAGGYASVVLPEMYHLMNGERNIPVEEVVKGFLQWKLDRPIQASLANTIGNGKAEK